MLTRSVTSGAGGAFGWERRMGVHAAYHRSALNRSVHWLCIPFELFAVIALLANVRVLGVDLALVTITLLVPIYCATEFVLGVLWSAALVALWWSTRLVFGAPGVESVLIPLALFATTFSAQLKVGHGIGERGIDDTPMNLFCFEQTKNPVPIVLIFYYHFVEIALAAGYRPALRARIELATATEIEEIAGGKPDAREAWVCR